MSSRSLAEKVRETYPRAQERRRGGLSDEILIVDRESNAVIGIGRTALAAWENALSRIAASLHSGVTT